MHNKVISIQDYNPFFIPGLIGLYFDLIPSYPFSSSFKHGWIISKGVLFSIT